jgi:hypothetical protein
MRTRDWRYKAGYTYGLHGTPTTFLLEERSARWKAEPVRSGTQRPGG